MDTQGFESDVVFDHRQGDHAVELHTEGLAGGEVFDKGEVVEDHLLAAAFDGILYKVEQPLLLKALDGGIDKVFGDTEVLFGEHIDLMGGHGLCVVAGQNENERLLVGAELLLEELLHGQGGVFGMFGHAGQGAGFEEVVEGYGTGAAVLEGEKLFIVQRKELQGDEVTLGDRGTADDNESGDFGECVEHPLFIVVENEFADLLLFYIGLQGQGLQGIEDEVWVFEVDVERRLVPLFYIVEYQCRFAAASCTVEIDVSSLRYGGFSQYKMLVHRRLCMIMFQ